VLIGLSVLLLLLLVSGGFAPPLMGVFVGIGVMRIGVPARRPPSAALRTLGRTWAWFVAAGVLGYLGLVPGTLVRSALTSMQGRKSGARARPPDSVNGGPFGSANATAQ
jgi:hypothetical protein